MKRISILLAGLSLMAMALSCKQPVPGQVKVTGGWIQGEVTEDMCIYKGIPFAAPPVGDLRWKEPQPVIPWEGVRDALEFGPGPVQGMSFPGSNNSEDCLYRNVWSPAKTPKDKLPVFVWIYGGGFAMGSSSQYDGRPLAEKGVILVTINYRVGQLGYFAHPELTAESPHHVSGNYGIMDQIAALQWVHDNIAAFGGDPSKVTIFGESAGGISVSMLCASPLAKGLISGAISQSGGSFGPVRHHSYPGENMKTLAMAEQDGVKYAEGLGAKSLAELRAMDAGAFARQMVVTGGAWPIVDGYVIPDDQYRMYENGNFNDVNVLIGYNSDEGASFGSSNVPEEHVAAVEERYGPYAEKLLAAYPLDGSSVVPKSARDLGRDASFGWHTWSWARLQSEKGKANVYMYYFDQHPDYPEDSPQYGHGSPHGQDVDYVFKSLRRENLPTDGYLSETMATYWTNFAKYGDPNGEGLPEWPKFTKDNHVTMVLTGSGPHPEAVPDEDAMWVLNEYFEWRRSPEGAAWAEAQP